MEGVQIKRFPTILTLLLAVLTIYVLFACGYSDQTEYPVYTVTEDDTIGCIELLHEGISYRPYGIIDRKFRGTQIGFREGVPESKICEVKGYASSEWIVEYLDVFMGGGDMLFKAVGTTQVPAELEQYKQYDF